MFQALPSTKQHSLFGNGTEVLLAAVDDLNKSSPTGIYVTLNPVREDVHRCARNQDIVYRRFFLVDIDRDKTLEPNACATDAEKEQVCGLGRTVVDYVRALGWPDPIIADSGNGMHLFWRVNLPNDDATNELFKCSLAALNLRFGKQIDTSVHDARRIIRLPGTVNAKGIATAERPHRVARILNVPASTELLMPALIQAVINANPPEQTTTTTITTPATTATTAIKCDRPGDDFNMRGSWEEILLPAGWRVSTRTHEKTEWTRPGKDDGCSATTGYCKKNSKELLYVFSSNAEPFEANTSYTKFGAYTQLNHNGDFKLAAKALAANGYGKPYKAKRDVDAQCEARQGGPNEAADDPSRLARIYVDKKGKLNGEMILYYWRQAWMRWDGSVYREVSKDEIHADLHLEVKAELDRANEELLRNWKGDAAPPTAIKVSRRLIGDVIDAVKATTHLSPSIESPAWIEGDSAESRNYLTFANGLLDLDACGEQAPKELLPHSPRWFSTNIFPYAFDAAATCPQWFKFLERNLEGDTERITLLQEWYGYNITPNTTLQKFAVFEGEGANGKSVACGALTAMLGIRNCSFVPLEMFGERFQLTQTLGKLANIAPECGDIDKVAEGVLKAFTSGDSMQFDIKNRSPIQAAPTARFVLATNNRPRFSDRSGGLWRRMILIPFRVVIPQEERVAGMDKPDYWGQNGELAGIFNWALIGLQRLRRNGTFSNARICEDAIAEYRIECNPAAEFLKELFEACVGKMESCEDMYKDYKAWCDAHGYHALGDSKFGGEVRRAFPNVDKKRIGSRGQQRAYYLGVSKITDGHPSMRNRFATTVPEFN